MVHNILKSLKDSVQKLKRFRVDDEWEEPVQQKNAVSSLALKLRVKYCRDLVGLPNQEAQQGKPILDPFVSISMIKREKVSYGELLEKYGKTYTTDVAFQTNNPEYDEEFLVPVQNYKHDMISISVYNDTKASAMRLGEKLKHSDQIVANLESSTDVASSASSSSIGNEKQTVSSPQHKKKALRRVRIGKVIIPCPGKPNVLKEEALQLDPNGGTLYIEYVLCDMKSVDQDHSNNKRS